MKTINTYNLILATSGELFRTHGMHRTTMDDIAKALCISKKTLYRYFPRKEALVNASVTWIYEQLVDELLTIYHSATAFPDKLWQQYRAVFTFYADAPRHLWRDVRQAPIAVQTTCREGQDEVKLLLAVTIQQGKRQGWVRENVDEDFSAQLWMALAESFPSLKLSTPDHSPGRIGLLAFHVQAILKPV